MIFFQKFRYIPSLNVFWKIWRLRIENFSWWATWRVVRFGNGVEKEKEGKKIVVVTPFFCSFFVLNVAFWALHAAYFSLLLLLIVRTPSVFPRKLFTSIFSVNESRSFSKVPFIVLQTHEVDDFNLLYTSKTSVIEIMHSRNRYDLIANVKQIVLTKKQLLAAMLLTLREKRKPFCSVSLMEKSETKSLCGKKQQQQFKKKLFQKKLRFPWKFFFPSLK